MDGVLARLAPEAVYITDGSATRRAAGRPVVGAARVGRFLANLAERYRAELTVTAATVNGEHGTRGCRPQSKGWRAVATVHRPTR
jgi:RNA polymerase sigma-70 factor, ECF subfamily